VAGVLEVRVRVDRPREHDASGGVDDLVRAPQDAVVGREPSPEFAAQVAEECNRMLDLLGDDTLRWIARWKMEGDTHAEVAVKLGCLERTVERKLRTIRDRWEKAT